MVLRKILDQYVSSYQERIKLVIRLGNNEVLKSLTKTLTFVDADSNANAEGNTIAKNLLLRSIDTCNLVKAIVPSELFFNWTIYHPS